MQWFVETLPQVDAEIDALPSGLRARLIRLFEVIEAHGLENIHEPHAKHLEGKLWELRVSAREGIARGIYVSLREKRVMVLHVFEKKTQKTPKRVMDLALARLKGLDE